MQIIHPHNPGIILDHLPEGIFKQLKEVVQKRREKHNTFDNPRKQSLQVLSIKEIDDTPYFEDMKTYLVDLFKIWCQTFGITCHDFRFSSIWTNYMKAGEFGPMHKHTPALVAFVIWVKIPYDCNKEKKFHYEGNDVDFTNRNGAFEFMYLKYDGSNDLYRIDLDKSDEGKILMFPGNLPHCVYPFFTSDQERISVAGNIYSLDRMVGF
jgi:hypothetical protein